MNHPMPPLAGYALVGLALAPAALAQAADPAAAPAQSSLWSMIREGGWAMIPLGLCSLALIYLAIHCLRETQARNFGGAAFAQRLLDLCQSGRWSEAAAAARQEPTLLGRALAAGLPKFDDRAPDASARAVEESVREVFEIEDRAISQWISYVNVVASVAPMVGLLGTVSGMIGAFRIMAGGGMGRPELLAGSIGEALITTATGLCIGIPAMVAYSYFSNRLDSLLAENAQRAGAVTDSLVAATKGQRREDPGQ